jgi:hypothetical protein
VDGLENEDDDGERKREGRGLDLPKDFEDCSRLFLSLKRIETQPGRYESDSNCRDGEEESPPAIVEQFPDARTQRTLDSCAARSTLELRLLTKGKAAQRPRMPWWPAHRRQRMQPRSVVTASRRLLCLFDAGASTHRH